VIDCPMSIKEKIFVYAWAFWMMRPRIKIIFKHKNKTIYLNMAKLKLKLSKATRRERLLRKFNNLNGYIEPDRF
jgi:hypothetical protein